MAPTKHKHFTAAQLAEMWPIAAMKQGRAKTAAIEELAKKFNRLPLSIAQKIGKLKQGQPPAPPAVNGSITGSAHKIEFREIRLPIKSYRIEGGELIIEV